MQESPQLAHTSAAETAADARAPRESRGQLASGGTMEWGLAILICAAFFAATAPTLHRLDFFDGVEHINLATVLELRRDDGAGQWLMPKLEGNPRTVKPPLTAWIAALAVHPSTIRDMAATDAAMRSSAFDRFVWECRWPTLLCSCALLLGVYELGRIVGGAGGWKTGLLSVLVTASCLLLLRQGRRATTDLQLALWVTLANAFLAKLIIERRIWVGSVGAGIALGLAIMSKGPHIAILQTAVPSALFAVYRLAAGQRPGGSNSDDRGRNRSAVLPISVGSALALAIGLWWYGYVLRAVPNVWNIWFHEVTRIDANALKPDPWYQYAATLLRFMMPWTAWMLLGIGYAVYESINRPKSPRDDRHGTPRIVLALLLLLVPLLVMSFFKERKERYLLPMVGPASVLAAYAISLYFRERRAAPLLPRLVDAATWVSIAALAVGMPVLGATHSRSFLTRDGKPWFTPTEAGAAAGLAGVILIAGFAAARRWSSAGVVAVVLAAWLGNEMQLRGYIAADADEDGRSARLLADRLWKEYPDAVVYDAESPTRYASLSLPAILTSLYFDRVVAHRPDALPTVPGTRPLVLLTEAPDQTPPPVPPGWRRFDSLPLRTGREYVDVLGR